MFFALANLISVALAASGTLETATNTASSSTPSIEVDVDSPYLVPFSGFTDNGSIPWGITVQNQTKTSFTAGFTSQLYEIVVNSSPTPNFTECNETPLVLTGAVALSNTAVTLITNPTIPSTLVLGTNTTLEVGSDIPDCSEISVVGTVPFGINLGRNGFWNGSLAFAGWYDANRIASTSWFPLVGGVTSDFLTSGQEKEVFVNLVNGSRAHGFLANVDFNNDSISIPSGISCGDDLALSIEGSSLGDFFNFTIPGDLINSPSRCATNAPNAKGPFVLGRPFFQAVYTYVDKTGQVFVAAANQYDLATSPAQFNPNATLKVPANPTPTPSPTTKSGGSRAQLNSALLGLLALWMII